MNSAVCSQSLFHQKRAKLVVSSVNTHFVMESAKVENSNKKKSRQQCYCDNNFQKIFEKTKLTGRLPYNSLLEKLYKGISRSKETEYSCKFDNQSHGAIFNLEFTPDARSLAAACERGSLLFFDPSTHKKTNEVLAAHDDCVNCIEFLDNRTFVTGSDDKTIRQWDLRNLKSQVNTLTGHQGWVKSLSYSKPAGLLFSSAFDTTLRVWNINGFNSDGKIKGHVLVDIEDVVRSKLSKDGSKLFLTEADGIVVIRDLDIFNGEDPSEVFLTLDLWWKQMPECLQTISGFPNHSDNWCVYTIDVHPYDWCIVTRYSDEDNCDMLVVHDVQDRDMHNDEGWIEDSCPELMTHYIKEAPSARGLIKEVCFSADGRIICSPDKNGVRLLAFNNNCHELSDCVPTKPIELSVVNSIYSHKRSVLTSKFSPILPQLATGCKAGEVCFHQPKF